MTQKCILLLSHSILLRYASTQIMCTNMQTCQTTWIDPALLIKLLEKIFVTDSASMPSTGPSFALVHNHWIINLLHPSKAHTHSCCLVSSVSAWECIYLWLSSSSICQSIILFFILQRNKDTSVKCYRSCSSLSCTI